MGQCFLEIARRCSERSARRCSESSARARLAGDTARAATSDEVKDLRREASVLKEVVAELTSKIVCSKKRDGGWGGCRMRYSASEKLEIIRLVEESALPVRRWKRLAFRAPPSTAGAICTEAGSPGRPTS
jgi:transposase-like protein